MRLTIFFVCLINTCFGEIYSDTIKQWRHSVRFTTYTANVIRFGGNELDYQITYAFNENTSISGRLGFFYNEAKSEKGYRTMKYASFPAFLGIQQVVSKNKKGFLEFNLGGSVLSYDDSRALTGEAYFLNFEEANGYNNFYRRFSLIQQFSFGYRFGEHLTANVGQTAYILKRHSSFDEIKRFAFSPGFSLSVGYTF